MVSAEASSQIFNNLKKDPENDKCFECDSVNPTFSSVNHGAFICSSCAKSHLLLGQKISRLRSLDDEWSLEDLKLMTAGGNSALKEFFTHYNILSAPPNFKYCTRAAVFYREMLAVVAEDNIFEQNCPEIEEGVEIVVKIYPELHLKGLGAEETRINLEDPPPQEESKKKNPWDTVKKAYLKAVVVGNKAANKLSEKINKFSEKPGVKKMEEKTKKFAEKIETGLNNLINKVYSKPAVQSTVSHLNNAADSFAREIKFTYTKINSNPAVNKMKEDTMNILKNIGIADSEPVQDNPEEIVYVGPSNDACEDLNINDPSYASPLYIPIPSSEAESLSDR